MLMRPLTHEVRAQSNQPRFSMPIGEHYEPRQMRPYFEGIVHPIVEPRHGMPNERPRPHFGGHFVPQIEEP
jgi:hypothetical protein